MLDTSHSLPLSLSVWNTLIEIYTVFLSRMIAFAEFAKAIIVVASGHSRNTLDELKYFCSVCLWLIARGGLATRLETPNKK